MLLVSNFTLHRNTNGENYDDIVDETTDTMESEVEVKKQRGQPRRNWKNGNKEWEDDEIFALIDAWSGIKQLFNCKHLKYHLCDQKMKSIEKIKGILHENGIKVTVKQIMDKIHSLRNYYGNFSKI